MAPLTGRHCLYEEGGCAWQAPQCDQISTTAQAEMYVRSHRTGCFYNPVVVQEIYHRREQAAVETSRRWAAEYKAEARLWEDEAKDRHWEDKAKAL